VEGQEFANIIDRDLNAKIVEEVVFVSTIEGDIDVGTAKKIERKLDVVTN
jgi:hypothetical protein